VTPAALTSELRTLLAGVLGTFTREDGTTTAAIHQGAKVPARWTASGLECAIQPEPETESAGAFGTLTERKGLVVLLRAWPNTPAGALDTARSLILARHADALVRPLVPALDDRLATQTLVIRYVASTPRT
jgi:hypothetical protein